MRHSVPYIFAAAGLGVGIAVALHAAVKMPATEPSSLLVSQLVGARPIGLLGKPLGSRLVVQGAMAQHVMLANPVSIESADGQPLKERVSIEVSGCDLKPDVGYELEGYESGAFQGEPEWHNPMVQQPFQYRPSFVVTRVIKPAAK